MGRVRPSFRSPIPRSRLPLHRRARMDPGWVRSWVLVIVGAVVVALAVSHAIGRAEAARRRWGADRTVLVASGPVRAGARLTGHVRPVPWPTSLVPDGALTEVGAADRAAVALDRGMPVTRAGVAADRADGPDPRPRVAVPLAEAHLPVRRGDRVDVWATVDPSLADGKLSTRRVAVRATVTAVDERAVAVAVRPSEVADVAEAVATATVTVVEVG